MKGRQRLILLGLVLVVGLLVLLWAAKVRSSPIWALEEKFARVKVGMSRDQVHEILGHDCGSFGGAYTTYLDLWYFDRPAGSNWIVMIYYESPVTETGEYTTRVSAKEMRRPESGLARAAGYLGF